MKSFAVAKRYSSALWAAAGDLKKADGWLTTLESLDELMRSSAELRELMNSPLFQSDKKLLVMSEILGKVQASKEVTAFVSRIVSGNRMNAFADIVSAFRVKVMAEKGIIELDVESALPLTEAQKQDLVSRFEKMTSKKVTVSVKLSPELLSGMKVSYGGKTLDGSLRTYLNNLEKHLLKEDFAKHATA